MYQIMFSARSKAGYQKAEESNYRETDIKFLDSDFSAKSKG